MSSMQCLGGVKPVAQSHYGPSARLKRRLAWRRWDQQGPPNLPSLPHFTHPACSPLDSGPRSSGETAVPRPGLSSGPACPGRQLPPDRQALCLNPAPRWRPPGAPVTAAPLGCWPPATWRALRTHPRPPTPCPCPDLPLVGARSACRPRKSHRHSETHAGAPAGPAYPDQTSARRPTSFIRLLQKAIWSRVPGKSALGCLDEPTRLQIRGWVSVRPVRSRRACGPTGPVEIWPSCLPACICHGTDVMYRTCTMPGQAVSWSLLGGACPALRRHIALPFGTRAPSLQSCSFASFRNIQSRTDDVRKQVRSCRRGVVGKDGGCHS